jgi:hypothetical protein
MRRTPTAAGRPFVLRRTPNPSHALGPIPLDWLETAARLPGRSLHTAVAIWIAAEVSGSTIVHLSNVASTRLSVDRCAKYRALNWLQAAGLIQVHRKLGKSPVVTILVPAPMA